MKPTTGKRFRWRTRAPARQRSRRGVVTVEAAVFLSLVMMLMLGVWEVGRVVQLTRTLQDAAREGARLAAGGVKRRRFGHRGRWFSKRSGTT